MRAWYLRRHVGPRASVIDGGRSRTTCSSVLGITDGVARVRSPFLFEIGEELDRPRSSATAALTEATRPRARPRRPRRRADHRARARAAMIVAADLVAELDEVTYDLEVDGELVAHAARAQGLGGPRLGDGDDRLRGARRGSRSWRPEARAPAVAARARGLEEARAGHAARRARPGARPRARRSRGGVRR